MNEVYDREMLYSEAVFQITFLHRKNTDVGLQANDK